jgi:hypothetical protein
MKFFYFFLLLSVSSLCFGQKTFRIEGDFTGMTFSQFVQAVEKQTDYHFYYKPAWTDSVAIHISGNGRPLEPILDELFTNTELQYAVDQDHHVFITKTRRIATELASGFFDQRPSNAGPTPEVFDYSEYEKQERKKKIAETKLFSIGDKSRGVDGKATLAGSVRDAATGEPIIGATIFIERPSMTGVATDQFGYYSITLPKGKLELKIKSIGMKSTQRQIMLYSNGKLDIDLDQDVTPLKEVVVESQAEARLTNVQMGTEKLDIQTMRQIPLALGETDVMKVVLTLPGVQSVGEGTVGLNVRGGATNQNLILLNDAVVYNPSHLFGFFSTFNPDILKNVELYKSGIKAEYGGRLSSVLDVHTREGNLKKISGSGGISPITGRLSLEGPIIKDKTSFIIGGRSTYSNWIMRRLKDDELKRSRAAFYDVTAGISHKIDDDNHIYLSGYLSQDRFNLKNDTAYSYSDRNGSLKWKHIFNNKLVGVLTGAYSNYRYTMSSDRNPINAFDMDFNIQQYMAKADFSYFMNGKHTFDGGFSAVRYNLAPGTFTPNGPESLIKHDVLENEHGLETALYASDQIELNPRMSLYVGLRYSFYQYLGPKNVLLYPNDLSREVSNVSDTAHYSQGKTIASYHGPEPRASFRYSVTNTFSVKLSYNRMRQYIQMLSNTTAIQPTDIWKLSDAYIRPQIGDQISLGLYKNLEGRNLIETSVEAYYKVMNNTIDYKDGSVLLMNHHIETDVLEAKGTAYGIEFLVKKNTGKINGWVSYAYSRSFLQTKGRFSNETVNKGDRYPSNFDKPHAVNFIGNYKFSRRFNFSLNLVYSTGRPITLPVVKYVSGGTSRVYYSDRNAYRIPDYFRTDISLNFEGNHKIKKLAHSSWTFAVYNLTGRANAYSIFFVSEGGEIKGYKLSIFAQAIPTITYNFKF